MKASPLKYRVTGLFSLARFRTTHEVPGAAQYLRRQDRVLGLSVAFMAEPALSRFIRFRFGIHKRIGSIVDVIGRHAAQAEGYAIQSFLEGRYNFPILITLRLTVNSLNSPGSGSSPRFPICRSSQ
jgi:hypothetical protein